MKTCAAMMGVLLLAGITRGADAPAATQESRDPSEIRRGMAMGGSSEDRQRRFYENVIRKIEPSGAGAPEKLPQYLDLFRREFVEDPRTFAFDVRAEQEESGAIVLRGHLEYDEHRKALATFLGQLGFDKITDEIESLPSPTLQDRPFGVVLRRCFVYDKPAEPRERLTECAPGDLLFLLQDTGNGALLTHAADGYVGYVEAGLVQRLSGPEFDARQAKRNSQVPPVITQVLDTAHTYMGVPYVWGGTSTLGIDCSGLVNSAYKAIGVRLPRDADQQSTVGALVATRWHRAAMRPGDVMFFLGRRGTVSHTALYIGDGRFIEATSPAVKISSLNPQDQNYSKRRDEGFCFAKRVLE
jgi:hypothetical protein